MNICAESFLSRWASFGRFEADPVVSLDRPGEGVDRASKDVERLLDPTRSWNRLFAERCARGAGTWQELFALLYDSDDCVHTYLAALVAREFLGSRAEVVVDGDLVIPGLTPRLGKVRLVAGDVIVRGHLRNRGCLVVLGSLVVDGVYSSSLEPISQCVVLGNMSVRGVSNCSWLTVRGDLQGAMAIYGRYNDRCTTVGGTIRTPLLISDDHSFRRGAAETHLTYAMGSATDETQRLAEGFLHPDLIIEDDAEEGARTLDVDSLLVRVRNCEPIFRP